MDIVYRVIHALFLGSSDLCRLSDLTNNSQGPVVGYMTDNYGPRIPILIGSFLHVFGLMMTSLSKKYYQIILSQSICSALGCSFLFYARKYPSQDLTTVLTIPSYRRCWNMVQTSPRYRFWNHHCWIQSRWCRSSNHGEQACCPSRLRLGDAIRGISFLGTAGHCQLDHQIKTAAAKKKV